MRDLPSTSSTARGSSSATLSRRRREARHEAAIDSNPRPVRRGLKGTEGDEADERLERLAKTLGIPVVRRLRLAAEIRRLAYGTLCRLPSQRPSAVVDELERALKRGGPGNGELLRFTREAWAMIGGNPDAGEFALRSGPAIVPLLEAALELARTFAAELDDAKGGRRADDRLDTFVRYLADLYQRECGRAPTYTIDPETGQLGGPFGQFVLECVRWFYPSSEVPWGSIRIAVRNCVAPWQPSELRKETDPLPD